MTQHVTFSSFQRTQIGDGPCSMRLMSFNKLDLEFYSNGYGQMQVSVQNRAQDQMASANELKLIKLPKVYSTVFC